MSDDQSHAFFDIIIQHIREGAREIHHGACTGSDAFVHHHMQFQMVETHVHPPTDKKYSAMDFLIRHNRRIDHEPATYAVRNQAIADASDILIISPRYPEKDDRSKRSGTWQTARMAVKVGKPVIVVDYDDGRVHPYGE